MGQIHYSFDPTREFELNGLFSLLNKLYSYIPSDPAKFKRVNFENSSEKDRKIKDQQDMLDRYVKDTEKNNARIDELNKQLDEAQSLNKIAEDEINEKTKKIEKLTDELSNHIKKSSEQLTLEVNKVKEEKEKEIAKLTKQISELMKKIAVYEPSLNGDITGDKYFNFYNGTLEETMSDDAPVIGKIDVEGNAIYQFNVEKGQHKTWSQNSEELKVYFDIIDSIDGANHISMSEWGMAQYNGGFMAIKTKAKIKLTRE